MATSKMGPKEAALRAQREARVADNKRLIDAKIKAKGVGKVVTVKAGKRGGRGK
jgi:hypothetical protein